MYKCAHCGAIMIINNIEYTENQKEYSMYGLKQVECPVIYCSNCDRSIDL